MRIFDSALAPRPVTRVAAVPAPAPAAPPAAPAAPVAPVAPVAVAPGRISLATSADVEMRYRGVGVSPNDLGVGECTMRSASHGERSSWMLWMPVAPGGSYSDRGPVGKTWGFTRRASGVWAVSPSIDVLVMREVRPGVLEVVGSAWHHNVSVSGIETVEPWM